MSYKRTVDAASEPVTLAEAKRHLRETLVDTDNDTDISALIKAARLACEERLQRTLITTTWQLTLDAFPEAIKVPMPRLIAVSSLAYLDSAGASQVLDPADYLVDALSEPGYIVPGVDLAWPSTQARINAVTVTYTAGYGATAASVPEPLKQWIKLAVGDMYERRSRSAEQPALAQDFVDALLDPYRIYGF
jgi:uncharacterized phiE125 gp8 family phage protein